jgi:hypothetical protein
MRPTPRWWTRSRRSCKQSCGNVGQAFQPAGSRDFLVPYFVVLSMETGDWKVARTGRLESLPYVNPDNFRSVFGRTRLVGFSRAKEDVLKSSTSYEPQNQLCPHAVGHPEDVVQSQRGLSRTAPAAVASGHEATHASRGVGSHLPAQSGRAGDQHRAVDRDSRAVREIYALWRPTPLLRAVRLERALQTPAHIYYKYEGVSPAGSHKVNTAVAAGVFQQAGGHETPRHRNRRRPMGRVARDCNQLFGLECNVYMVKVSYDSKPYRRMLMHTWGATVHASPSNQTEYGRKLQAEDPHCAGSLGIAISEAIEDTVKTSEHQILPRQRAESRLPASIRHRRGNHQADGTGGRRTGCDLRLLRRRQ